MLAARHDDDYDDEHSTDFKLKKFPQPSSSDFEKILYHPEDFVEI